MLVLSRKRWESIIIETSAGTVTIEVQRISENRVSLAILAPPEISVDRAEVREKKKEAVEASVGN